MDGISCQAERKLSVFRRTVDKLRSGKVVDNVEQLMLLRINKQLIPEIASFRDAETNTYTCTP